MTGRVRSANGCRRVHGLLTEHAELDRDGLVHDAAGAAPDSDRREDRARSVEGVVQIGGGSVRESSAAFLVHGLEHVRDRSEPCLVRVVGDDLIDPIVSAPQASDRASIGARKPPPPISVTFIDVVASDA